MDNNTICSYASATRKDLIHKSFFYNGCDAVSSALSINTKLKLKVYMTICNKIENGNFVKYKNLCTDYTHNGSSIGNKICLI